MSVLEKQIVKLQRRVEELEKLAAEARTLKQELDDRVTAGKALKSSNIRLQKEVVALERRLGELEVEKDTKGTFTFGGGAASTKALRRTVSIARHAAVQFSFELFIVVN
eukprot:495056-Prorocentrum_minimum.AAC.3